MKIEYKNCNFYLFNELKELAKIESISSFPILVYISVIFLDICVLPLTIILGFHISFE